MTGTTAELLPLSGATLRSDARVLESVRAIGERHGVDYTDDAAVRALLTERRRAVQAAQHGASAWIGGLALMACVVWPFIGASVPSLAAKPALAYGPAGPLLMVAVASLTWMRARWKRELMHGALVGYREVLGVARAHGLPLAHVPRWLEGRSSSGGGKGATPIPSYPKVPKQTRQEGAASTPDTTVTVPPKPAAVSRYERIADAGGWHDETGCLLVMVGAGGALWAATNDAPLWYGAIALVPLAILVWLAGSNQGTEKERLRAEAVAYVRAVAEAQAAGAQVPELSRVLRKLLDEVYLP